MSVLIVPVQDKKQLKKFIDFPHDLYKEDPNYVPELFIAQRDILSRDKNPFFQHGDIQPFLAFENDRIVGRIAAIYNGNYISYTGQNNGFWGFFDSIDNQEVATQLFDAVTEWLRQKKVTNHIIGPVNPTTNDTCGLLIEDYDRPPMAMMTYNFPYYTTLIENCGYGKQVDLLAYIYKKGEYTAERLKRLQTALRERLAKRGITIRPLNFSKKLFTEEFKKVKEVYNSAWDKNLGFVPLTDAEFEHSAKDLKSIITDPNLCQIAELEGKFIGWALMVPNINEIMQHLPKGRLLPFGFIKLLTGMKKVTSMRIVTLGVVEEYRKLGIESIFYSCFVDIMESNKYLQEVEASWILEDNVMMNKGIQDIGGKVYKKYRLFEKHI